MNPNRKEFAYTYWNGI